MNFFGHAVVASWKCPEPRFVLGAMLPDFANILGSRLVGPRDPTLASGVAFHYRTDQVFHDSAEFNALVRAALRELGELGLRRGSARAVAHVGTEILLDAVLAADGTGSAVYRAALEVGASRELAIDFRDSAASARLGDLSRLLLARGVAARHATPALVAQRLERTLAHRPRLALQEDDRAKVEIWAEHNLPAVEARASALMQELAAGLL